jgi:hypothetical protein
LEEGRAGTADRRDGRRQVDGTEEERMTEFARSCMEIASRNKIYGKGET